MAEEVVKTVENVDTLFPEIVVNGQSHVSDRYVAPEPAQPNTPATQQEEETQSSQPQAVTQGQFIDRVQLNSVQHSLKDSPLAQEVSALQELLGTIQTRLNQIGALIPSTATAENQLADKNFVNSSIATNTANFLGTYSTLAEIEAIPNPTNNDYAFLETEDASGNNVYDRYKYSEEDEQWLFEYELNNSSFTAEQWATINSGITQVSDTVQSGDTNPVESNAVYEALQNVATEMPVYPTLADAQQDLPNLDEGQFIATEEGDNFTVVDVVQKDIPNPVSSNAVAQSKSYFTTEHFTGKYWIDRKPIYRVVIKPTVSSTASDPRSIGTFNRTNVDRIISYQYTADQSDRVVSNFYTNRDDGGSYKTSLYIASNGNLMFINRQTVTDLIIIIEYTKTTD